MASTLTPSIGPGGPNSPMPTLNNAAIREMIDKYQSALQVFNTQFQMIDQQAPNFEELESTVDSKQQITNLRRQLKMQEKKQENRIADVKRIVKDALKDQIADSMKEQIAQQIREEIAVQVQDQVSGQIREHVPIMPAEQLDASLKQMLEVQITLQNLEARRQNSTFRPTALEDDLGVVLKPNGTKSKYYPKNLRSLFDYDDVQAKTLAEDFELPLDESRERNLNRFIAHIGVTFTVISVPAIPS